MAFDPTTIRWNGSGSAVNINTVPFGFYLNENSIQTMLECLNMTVKKVQNGQLKDWGIQSLILN